tara:strand:- start:11044 stop:11310 length:267 start_codon:yes stop_codon:yes gene_type:complete
MPSSKKSTQTSTDWYEKVVNEQVIKTDHKILEERIAALEKRVEELSARPIGKIMYRAPGRTEHQEVAKYLDSVENRLNTIELRQEIDV